MPTLRLLLLAALVITIAIYLIERRQTHQCPVCKSSKVKEEDRTTEQIDVDKREIPGIGSKVHVTATVSRRCQSCGHTWQLLERN